VSASSLRLLTLLVPRAVGGTYIDSNLAVSSAAHADGGGCYPVPLNESPVDPKEPNSADPSALRQTAS
jgi:hypothetical protein